MITIQPRRRRIALTVFEYPLYVAVALTVIHPVIYQGGYEILYTPHMANLDLWKTSGHHDFYRNDMFRTIEVEDEQYQIKPMNCPFHCLIYKVIDKLALECALVWT